MAAAVHIDESDLPDPSKPPEPPKVKLAVFDFDGTCIDGKSPVILTWYLLKNHLLRKSDGFLVAVWGLAYKLHIPVNESWVRSTVFKAFEGKPQQKSDAIFTMVYDEKIARRFRPSIVAEMQRCKAEGCTMMTVSATFEPLILRMLEAHPFDYEISTRMIVDDQGNYTKKVEGLPIEGAEKVAAIRRFANERYGAGKWEIVYAYSDHCSDRPLLYAAYHPAAVDPDHLLRHTAKKEGWPIIEK